MDDEDAVLDDMEGASDGVFELSGLERRSGALEESPANAGLFCCCG